MMDNQRQQITANIQKRHDELDQYLTGGKLGSFHLNPDEIHGDRKVLLAMVNMMESLLDKEYEYGADQWARAETLIGEIKHLRDVWSVRFFRGEGCDHVGVRCALDLGSIIEGTKQ